MKPYSKIVTLLAASLILLSSCEKTIDVNTPPYDRKLTVNCRTLVNEPLYVVVGTSAAIKDQRTRPELLIKNAEVKLYVDDVYTETLTFDGEFGYPSTTAATPGKKYTVKVAAASYTGAEASVVVPSQIQITSMEYTPYARKDPDGNEQDAVTIRFDDPSAPNDYYIIVVESPTDGTSYYYNQKFCVNSVDASIESNSGEIGEINKCIDNLGIFMRDDLFNGSQKELKLYSQSANLQPYYNGTDTVYAKISLLHVPEDYFKFEKSNILAVDANDNPFAEPINVYSNVKNGLGIFSVISLDLRTIK